MASTVVLNDDANKTSGVWVDVNGGEVCIYKDEDGRGIVVGHYKEKNKTPIDRAVMFNTDGSVVLQESSGGTYEFSKLNPDKVAARLVDFLRSLEYCVE